MGEEGEVANGGWDGSKKIVHTQIDPVETGQGEEVQSVECAGEV